MARILVVDDEPTIGWALSRLGTNLGHDVDVASSAEQGLELAATRPPGLVVLDVRLPGIDGLAAIHAFRQCLGPIPIIVITAFGDLKTAVAAVKNGAFEYIVKPFDLATIRDVIQRALQTDQGLARTSAVVTTDGLLGRSPAMQEVFRRIALAADSHVPVIVYGESGVGKELAAQAIHRHSDRAESPWVAVNLAALSPTLAEAELFGHVDGAFTGSRGPRKGLLVQANGGTLFLDEVAEIPISLQVKLLRVLDQGEVLPLGADQPVQTRFRLIAASHQDLREQVRCGQFRHDLFYRLAAFEIVIPPLRERIDDIPLLAAHFAADCSTLPVRLAEETIVELQRRRWHGNVRELRNAIEHAVVIARSGVILPHHLPADACPLEMPTATTGESTSRHLEEAIRRLAQNLLVQAAESGTVYEQWLNEVEPPLLASVMHRFHYECAPAARALGLHRTTLKKKLERYGLAADRP